MAAPGYTREQWARGLLHYLGNDTPSQQTVDFVVKWTVGETYGPGGSGLNNLLNTTQGGFGSAGGFQSTGSGAAFIRNYPTFTQGVRANVHALQNGLYPALARALRTNDIKALLFDPEVRREIQHVWGTSTWNPAGAAHDVYSGNVPRNQRFPEGTPGKGDIPVAQPRGAFSVTPHRALFGQPYAISVPAQTKPKRSVFGIPFSLSLPRQPFQPSPKPKATSPQPKKKKLPRGIS